MNDPLDTLMRNDWLRPPADFTQTVMRRVAALPRPAAATTARWHTLRRAAAVAAMIGGGLLGLTQLAAYVFGPWLAGAAL